MAQDLESSLAQSSPEISQETTNTDINLVEQNTDLSYKFGDRIEASKFAQNKIGNDICGKSVDFFNSQFGSKFDPKASSTVIKTLKTKCKNSTQNSTNSSQNLNSQISSWLKMVWDNGWVKIRF